MTWQYAPFIITFFITALALGVLTLYMLPRRHAPGAWQVVLFLGAATLWSTAYAFELASVDISGTLFFTLMEYPGIVTVPVAWFLFVLNYTGKDWGTKKPFVYSLFAVPVLTLCIMATNNIHHLFYSAITPAMVGGTVIWIFSYGLLFWIHGIYSYVLIIGGVILMIEKYLISPPVFRHQISILLLASLVPFIVNIIYVLNLGPVPGLDLTPFAFLVTGVALVVASSQFRLFSLMPVTYSLLVEKMDDGLVVFNQQNTIIAINPAAARLGRSTPDLATGKSLSAIIPQLADVFCTDTNEQYSEVRIPLGEINRNFEVRCIPLREGNKTLLGHLLLLRDITDQKAAAAALREANLKLKILNDITRHDIRNKMTGLLLHLDSLKEALDPAEIKSIIKKIDETAQVIVRQIEFTRTYQDLGVKSSLWQNIDDVVARVIPQIDLRDVVVYRDLDNVELYADPLLERVVYNLLENSVKYGSTLTSIWISAEETKDGLRVTFRDNGVGIPLVEKEKIFSRGYGTNTGLGLFLSREILAITGITIRETGDSGNGACFVLIVPKGKYRII
jgi:signal transduction histidine kinase